MPRIKFTFEQEVKQWISATADVPDGVTDIRTWLLNHPEVWKNETVTDEDITDAISDSLEVQE